jgi:hypothetical protein
MNIFGPVELYKLPLNVPFIKFMVRSHVLLFYYCNIEAQRSNQNVVMHFNSYRALRAS